MPVFVYGTLTHADRVDELLDDWRFDGAAVIEGLERVEGRYPTLAPGAEAQGALLVTSRLDALDAYEGIDAGLYVRVAVPVVDGDAAAWVYVGNPDRLDAPAEWPGDGSFADRVRRYIDAAGVRVHRSRNR